MWHGYFIHLGLERDLFKSSAFLGIGHMTDSARVIIISHALRTIGVTQSPVSTFRLYYNLEVPSSAIQLFRGTRLMERSLVPRNHTLKNNTV